MLVCLAGDGPPARQRVLNNTFNGGGFISEFTFSYEAYPFRPEAAIPSVNCFCVKKYRIRIGIIMMTDAAICK